MKDTRNRSVAKAMPLRVRVLGFLSSQPSSKGSPFNSPLTQLSTQPGPPGSASMGRLPRSARSARGVERVLLLRNRKLLTLRDFSFLLHDPATFSASNVTTCRCRCNSRCNRRLYHAPPQTQPSGITSFILCYADAYQHF